MRFADELRSTKAVGLPKEPAKVDRAQVKKFEQAIAALGAKKLDPKELEDEQARQLLALVERKRKSHQDLVEVPELAAEAEDHAEIIDLMEVLKRSLGVQGPRAGAKPASAGAKRGSTKRRKAAAKSGKR
jgi:non-homologous end joining protein Ku